MTAAIELLHDDLYIHIINRSCTYIYPAIIFRQHNRCANSHNIQKLIDLRGYYRVTGRHPGYKQFNPDDELLHKKD